MRTFFFFILLGVGIGRADTLNFLAPPFQRQDPTELFRLLSELERLTPVEHSRKIDVLVVRYFLSRALESEGMIHAKQNELKSVLESCENFERNKYGDLGLKLKARLISVCLIATSEMLNYVSSFGGFSLSGAKDSYFALLELSRLDPSDALFVEALIYSNLPPFYGQKLGKALLNLEMLKRMHPEYSLPRELAESIRVLQSKSAGHRVIKDGQNFGIFPTIYGSSPQGFGLQLRFQDERMWDQNRAVRGRVFGTVKGSFGGEFRYDDDLTISETQLSLKGTYLYGIQEFHGFGIRSSKDSIDLYFNRATGEISFKKTFCEFCGLRVGWKVNSAHFRKSDSTPTVGSELGVSNSFDSGAFAELSFDTTESRYDPYEGRRVSFLGYFPVKDILSSHSYEKYEFAYDEFLKLGTKYTLRASVMLDAASAKTPFWFIPQLSGQIPLPAVRLTRFQDKNVLGSWMEFRGRNWEPLTWLAFVTTGTVAGRFSEVFRNSFQFGFGAGGEFKLSRFRHRMLRVEVGSFASEFSLKAQFWVPID